MSLNATGTFLLWGHCPCSLPRCHCGLRPHVSSSSGLPAPLSDPSPHAGARAVYLFPCVLCFLQPDEHRRCRWAGSPPSLRTCLWHVLDAQHTAPGGGRAANLCKTWVWGPFYICLQLPEVKSRDAACLVSTFWSSSVRQVSRRPWLPVCSLLCVQPGLRLVYSGCALRTWNGGSPVRAPPACLPVPPSAIPVLRTVPSLPFLPVQGLASPVFLSRCLESTQ